MMINVNRSNIYSQRTLFELVDDDDEEDRRRCFFCLWLLFFDDLPIFYYESLIQVGPNMYCLERKKNPIHLV